MDEYLFISMAKLGADRVKAERIRRGATAQPSKPARPIHQPQESANVVPSELASRLANFALLFAGALAALGIGGGLAASLEHVPAGKVTVSEIDASANQPAEAKVAHVE